MQRHGSTQTAHPTVRGFWALHSQQSEARGEGDAIGGVYGLRSGQFSRQVFPGGWRGL